MILDTGAVIALERGQVDRIDVLPDDADVAMSAVSASELLVGVELADDVHCERRREMVEGVIERVDIIPFDVAIARHRAGLVAYARGSGRPRGAHDLQIAATAKATSRLLVTTDAHAFDDLPGVSFRLLS